jgi:hypothetical protein
MSDNLLEELREEKKKHEDEMERIQSLKDKEEERHEKRTSEIFERSILNDISNRMEEVSKKKEDKTSLVYEISGLVSKIIGIRFEEFSPNSKVVIGDDIIASGGRLYMDSMVVNVTMEGIVENKTNIISELDRNIDDYGKVSKICGLIMMIEDNLEDIRTIKESRTLSKKIDGEFDYIKYNINMGQICLENDKNLLDSSTTILDNHDKQTDEKSLRVARKYEDEIFSLIDEADNNIVKSANSLIELEENIRESFSTLVVTNEL